MILILNDTLDNFCGAFAQFLFFSSSSTRAYDVLIKQQYKQECFRRKTNFSSSCNQFPFIQFRNLATCLQWDNAQIWWNKHHYMVTLSGWIGGVMFRGIKYNHRNNNSAKPLLKCSETVSIKFGSQVPTKTLHKELLSFSSNTKRTTGLK